VIPAQPGTVALFGEDARPYLGQPDNSEYFIEWPVTAFDADGWPLILVPYRRTLVHADSIPDFQGLDYRLDATHEAA
jgi:hypothetical protein